MAICQKCGREIPENQTLCDTCAAVSQPVTASVAEEPVSATPTPPYFQPDFTAPRPTQPYIPPVGTFRIPLAQEELPPEYKPLGAWTYFLYNLLFSLPLIGLICLIVFACGGTSNINLRNYARSFFCGWLVALILIVLLVLLVIALGVQLDAFSPSGMEDILMAIRAAFPL